MPSTRRSKAALDATPKPRYETGKSPKRDVKGSVPKVTGRRTKSNWKTERITQLLRLGDNDEYPPSITEINAATRIIDLETAIKNSKSSDHDKIEKKIKEAFLKLNAVLSKRRNDPPPRTGDNSDDPIELDDWDDTDSEDGTGNNKTKKTEISYDMLLSSEDEGPEEDNKMDESPDPSIEATDKNMFFSGSDGETSPTNNDMEYTYTEKHKDADKPNNEMSIDLEVEEKNENEDKDKMETEFEYNPNPESGEQEPQAQSNSGKPSSLSKASQLPSEPKGTPNKPDANKIVKKTKPNANKTDLKASNPYSKENNKKNSAWTEKGTMKDAVLIY